jgi:hypothetical protein
MRHSILRVAFETVSWDNSVMTKLTSIDAAMWNLGEVHIDKETSGRYLDKLIRENPAPSQENLESFSSWDEMIAEKLLHHFRQQALMLHDSATENKKII